MNNKKITILLLLGAISLSSISLINNNFKETKNNILQVNYNKENTNSPLANYLSEMVFGTPNDFNKITQEDFNQIRTLNLTNVYMNLNNGNSKILNKLKNLKTINIINSNIIGEFPICNSLVHLNMLNSNFVQNSFSNIGNSSNLQTIKIQNSTLSSSLVDSIGNLKNLKSINIINSTLNSKLPNSLCNLSQLQNLTIINSNFQGGLPTNIGNLTMLNTLKIINTSLSGVIPPSIKNLKNLRDLELTNTGINGTIPSSIGYLTNLNILGLSGNNLIGFIPTSLNNLSNLATLSLNNNQLIGDFVPKNKNLQLNLKNNLLNIPNGNQSFLTSKGNISDLNDLNKYVHIQTDTTYYNYYRFISNNYILKLKKLASNKAQIEIIGYKGNNGIITNLKSNSIYKNIITNSFNYKNNFINKSIKPEESSFNSSDLKSFYSLNNGDIVLNCNIKSNTAMANKIKREVILKNSNGAVVCAFNATPVNWYSDNSHNYSGFQSILNSHALSLLKSNNTYNLFVRIYENNNYYDVPIFNLNNLKLNNNKFNVGINDNKELTISKNTNSNIVKASSVAKNLYFSNGDYVINGNINVGNNIISKNLKKEIILKNSSEKIIKTINTIPVDWYGKSGNFSGFQCIISNNILNNLNKNENYNVFIKFSLNGKNYNIPLEVGNLKLISNSIIKTINNSGTLSVLAPLYKANTEGYATVEKNGTGWLPYGYVINAKVHISSSLSKNSKISIISKNSSNNINATISATPVNWYNGDKSDYSGFQVIITPQEIAKLSGNNNKLFVQIFSNNSIYMVPLKGNITSNKSLGFSLNNLNNQVIINKM